MARSPEFPGADPYVYVLYTYDGDIPGTSPGGIPAVAAPKYGNGVNLSDTAPDPTGRGPSGERRLSRLQANGNFMTGTEQVLVHDWVRQPQSFDRQHRFGADGACMPAQGDTASFNYVDYGQPIAPNNPGNPFSNQPNEGGALRPGTWAESGGPGHARRLHYPHRPQYGRRRCQRTLCFLLRMPTLAG